MHILCVAQHGIRTKFSQHSYDFHYYQQLLYLHKRGSRGWGESGALRRHMPWKQHGHHGLLS